MSAKKTNIKNRRKKHEKAYRTDDGSGHGVRSLRLRPQQAAPAPAAEAPAAEAPAAEAPAAEAPAAEQTVLKLWCIATESDANRPGYEKAIAEFEAAHPDIKIEWEAFENNSYKTKIKAAMMGGDTEDLPDIFFTWAGAFLGDFAEVGSAYCLDEAYKPFASDLPEVMLQNSTYGGKHFGVPLTYNIVTLFANMDLLAEVGYTEVPQTYEDLTACCDALVEKGIIPFGCAAGSSDTWCVTEYLEPIIEKTIGYEAMNEIFGGRATWNDPAIATAVNNFQDMVKKGYFDPNGMAIGNDQVKANFIAGQYAFYQNGSWNCGEIDGADFTAKAALFPVMDTAKATYGQVIGGPSDTLAVCAYSKNAELASSVAFELGRSICHYCYLAGSGLPAWTPDYDTSEVKQLVSDVAEIVSAADGMVLFGDTAMSADPAQVYLDYVSQVYGCEINGEDFVAGLTADLG